MELSKQKLNRLESIYFLYLDETGNATFNANKAYADVNARFLTIAGFFIRGDTYWTKLTEQIRELKLKYFGTEDVILHFSDMFLSRSRAFRESEREAFWQDFQQIISSTECSLVSITIDKQRMQESYKQLWDPYHLVIAWHIERAVYTLRRIEARIRTSDASKAQPLQAKVIVEARGGGDDRRTGEEIGPDRKLARYYRRVYDRGTKLDRKGQTVLSGLGAKEIQARLASSEIALSSKQENKIGLQVADLVCFSLHWNTIFELSANELHRMKGQIEKMPSVKAFWEILRAKIASSDSGQVEGYGIKLFPSEQELF